MQNLDFNPHYVNAGLLTDLISFYDKPFDFKGFY